MSNARNDLATAVKKALLDRVEWRPMAQTPKEGTVTLLTDERRRVVGVFRNGEWKGERGRALTFEPTYWLGFKGE